MDLSGRHFPGNQRFLAFFQLLSCECDLQRVRFSGRKPLCPAIPKTLPRSTILLEYPAVVAVLFKHLTISGVDQHEIPFEPFFFGLSKLA